MKIGFIGCGNMGGAVATAVRKNVNGSNIYLANRTFEKAEKLAKKLRANATDNKTIAKGCDFIVLGVKPQMMEDMLNGIKDELRSRQDRFVLVTMAAALSMDDIRRLAGGDYPVIRIMPNTPVSTGEGVIMYSYDYRVNEDELREFKNAVKAAGKLVELPEKLIDAGSAVAGCGPAFAELFIEALADGGVACGLPRKQATELAAQMLLGSAKLTLATGKTPGELKDQVCSPGGTTIQGVRVLEERGFRGAAMDAVIAAYDKTVSLKK